MIYIFKCPVCRKLLRFGYRCEPCCTGPNEGLDEHELEVMRLFKIGKDEVDPVASEKSTRGPLIIPPGYNP